MVGIPWLARSTPLAFIALWPLAIGVAYVAGRRGGAARRWWDLMTAQWRPVLVVALFYPVGALAVRVDGGTIIGGLLEGIVLGYVYVRRGSVRRGYETAVLGHTLTDWFPLLLAA